jgi:hypothetical protein
MPLRRQKWATNHRIRRVVGFDLQGGIAGSVLVTAWRISIFDTPFPIAVEGELEGKITFRPLSVISVETIKPIGQGASTFQVFVRTTRAAS